MVVVGRLDQKMPGPIFCPSPALIGNILPPTWLCLRGKEKYLPEMIFLYLWNIWLYSWKHYFNVLLLFIEQNIS